ncbi:polysaccharide biosynthesis tyrosine autokinase [Lelliottia sp. RWM.1]|nr:polysaccharide biosynthesis tyrosine autokinase [Lelliottia sp. RWM.1]MBM3071064.1 polysaccharide biosynthesis tyrosine autokinase [Lelliottia sp. RWM.1]
MSSNSTHQYKNTNGNQTLDLVRLLGELFDNRIFILCMTLLLTICTSLYVVSATPVYKADALVQVVGKQNNNVLKRLTQMNSELAPDAAPDMMLLKSRMILGKTVDDLGLKYEVSRDWLPVVGRVWAKMTGQHAGRIVMGRVYLPWGDDDSREFTITAGKEGEYRVEGKDFHAQGRVGETLEKGGVIIEVSELTARPGVQFTLKEIPTLEAISALSKAFTVTETVKQSGVLKLSLTGADPMLITRTLNAITENYLQQNVDRQALRDTRRLNFLQQYIPEIQRELVKSEEQLNRYRQQRNSVDLTLETKSVLEQIVNINNHINELTLREADIAQRYSKSHPVYRSLIEKRNALEATKSRLNKKVSELPLIQQAIIRLSRDVDSGSAVYQHLLTRQQELSLSRSSAMGNVRIIDAAQTLSTPVEPKKGLIVACGALLGFLLSAVVVILRMALRRGINSPEQLEARGISILATVPHSDWLWRKTHLRRKHLFQGNWQHKTRHVPFLPVAHPHDVVIESIRGLRTRLHFALMGSVNRIVMVSGPTQNCGKTLISTSLAAIVAQAELKVLFIDADMRKGYAHDIFSLSNRCGLAEVLMGNSSYQNAIQRYTDGDIDVITCGQPPENPSELLMGEVFQSLLMWVNERYDMVIVDTPPVLAVTDATVVGRMGALTILIARHGMTSVKEIEISMKRLHQAGVEVSGTILNDVVKSAANKYGAGYSHYGKRDVPV